MPEALWRPDRAVACVLALVVIGLGSLRLTPDVCGNYHDDGIYVSTAKALAEGRGYTLINLPGEPAQTKYPILYPAALSVLWRLWPHFPENLIALQALSLLSAAAAVALAYLHMVRLGYASRGQAAAACAICACSPTFLYFATQTLSESTFSLLLVLALWRTDREVGRSATHWKSGLFTGIVIAMPFLCRTIGAVIPPVSIWLLYKARKPVLPALIGTAAAVLPWVTWVAFNSLGASATTGPEGYYTIQNYVGWWLADSSMLRVYVLNLIWLFSGTAFLPLEGLMRASPWQWATFGILGLLMWTQLIFGTRRGPVLARAFPAYAAVVVLWPWSPVRFLVPLMPYLALALVLVAGRAVARLTGTRGVYVLRGAMLVILASNTFLFATHVRLTWQTGYPYERVPEQPAAWSDFRKLFAWVRSNSASGDVVAGGMDSMIHLYTQRHSTKPFVQRPTALFYGDHRPPLGSVEEFTALLRRDRIRYVLEHPMPGFAEERPFSKLIGDTRREWPSCLEEAYRVPGDVRFVAFAVNLASCGS